MLFSVTFLPAACGIVIRRPKSLDLLLLGPLAFLIPGEWRPFSNQKFNFLIYFKQFKTSSKSVQNHFKISTNPVHNQFKTSRIPKRQVVNTKTEVVYTKTVMVNTKTQVVNTKTEVVKTKTEMVKTTFWVFNWFLLVFGCLATHVVNFENDVVIFGKCVKR